MAFSSIGGTGTGSHGNGNVIIGGFTKSSICLAKLMSNAGTSNDSSNHPQTMSNVKSA
jgi:hypothetical protein